MCNGKRINKFRLLFYEFSHAYLNIRSSCDLNTNTVLLKQNKYTFHTFLCCMLHKVLSSGESLPALVSWQVGWQHVVLLSLWSWVQFLTEDTSSAGEHCCDVFRFYVQTDALFSPILWHCSEPQMLVTNLYSFLHQSRLVLSCTSLSMPASSFTFY